MNTLDDIRIFLRDAEYRDDVNPEYDGVFKYDPLDYSMTDEQQNMLRQFSADLENSSQLAQYRLYRDQNSPDVNLPTVFDADKALELAQRRREERDIGSYSIPKEQSKFSAFMFGYDPMNVEDEMPQWMYFVPGIGTVVYAKDVYDRLMRGGTLGAMDIPALVWPYAVKPAVKITRGLYKAYKANKAYRDYLNGVSKLNGKKIRVYDPYNDQWYDDYVPGRVNTEYEVLE